MADNQIILEFLANTDGLKAAAQQLQLLGKINKEQYEQFTKAGADYQKQLKETALFQQALGQSINGTTGEALLLNNQFRTMADAIAKGALTQAVNQFKQVADQAAKTSTAVKETGNQLNNIDADGTFASLLDSARDVVSVLTLAKDTTALFGAEHKQLVNGINKATQVINLASDAQKVANNLIKEGGVLSKAYGLTLAFAETLQKQFALSATAAWTAATGGIALVVAAVGGMAYAITKASGQSVEGIQMLTEELQKAYEQYNAWTENINQQTSTTQIGLEKELFLLREKGATLSEVQDMENKIAAEKKRSMEEQKFALVNNAGSLQMLTAQYAALFNVLDRSKSENNSREEIDALKAQLDGVGKLIDEHKKLDLALAKFDNDEQIRKKKQGVERMSNARIIFEQETLLNKKYSEEEKKAQLDVLEQERQIKLQSLTLTNEQAILINLQFNRDKLLLEQQYEVAALSQAKQNIQARLAAQREGTKEEFNTRILAIQAAANEEIAAVKENTVYAAQQRKNIQDIANADILKLHREFAFKTAQSQIEADQAYQQTRMATAKKNSREMLAAELALIDAQADAKRLAIDKHVVDEAEHKNKLILLDEETMNAKLAKQIEFYEAIKSLRQTDIDSAAAHAKANAELNFDKPGTGGVQQHQLKLAQFEIEKEALAAQSNLVEETYQKELAAYTALNKDTTALDKQYALDKQAITDAIALNDKNAKKEVYEYEKGLQDLALNTSVQIAQQALDAIFSARSAAIQQDFDNEMAKLEERKNKELDNENLTQGQRAAIERKYQQEAAALKLKQWKAEQSAKLEQAIINGALAITMSLASSPVAYGPIPNPAGIASLAMVVAQTAIQVATIAAAKPPRFARGGKNIPAGMKLVGEEGPELLWTPGGETVIPHGDTTKILQAWSIPVPNLVPGLKDDVAIAAALPVGIDYRKMAKLFADELRNNPMVKVNLDRNGYALHLIDKGKRVELLNNRYEA